MTTNSDDVQRAPEILTSDDLSIALDLTRRRDAFGKYLAYPWLRVRIIQAKGQLPSVTCPACGYLTMVSPTYDTCGLCAWSEDGQDDPVLDVITGANEQLTLATARRNFREHLSIFDRSDKGRAEHRAHVVEQKSEIVRKFDALAVGVSAKQFFNELQEITNLIASMSEGIAREMKAEREAREAREVQ